MRNALSFGLIVAGYLVTNVAAAAETSVARPNFVLIYCDDLGYGDVGCFGAAKIRTPSIDSLASDGRKFTSFCVAQAVCSASRTALLTGCYPNRVGILGALFPQSRNGIHDAETTVAELLKSRGYRTAIFGKWHLGHHPQFLPTRHGFDEYFGLPYSNDMGPRPDRPAGSAPPLPLIEGDRVVETNPDMSSLTSRYTERAVRFIDTHHAEPFFLYLSHSMPHVPLGAGDKHRGKSAQGLYGDVIEEIDWSVGQILDTLRHHRLDERTLVMFASDNGPWLVYGEHGGSAGPLREGKGTAWEGGIRVPCVMRWTNHIPAGTETAELASTLDILPTFAKLAGATPPADRRIDGVDVSRLLLEPSGMPSPRESLLCYYGEELRAVRKGSWKLYFPHAYKSVADPSGKNPGGKNGKPGRYADGKCGLELYNLANDIGERHNVAAGHPEIVAELERLAEAGRADLGDSLTGRKGANLREPGRL